MLRLDLDSPVPLNDQIKAGLRGLVSRGLLKPGERAPSVRALAASLKVNPNTVARAFRELIEEGVFESRRGDGSFVSGSAAKRAERGLEKARESLSEALRHARRGGLEWDDIEKTVRAARGGER